MKQQKTVNYTVSQLLDVIFRPILAIILYGTCMVCMVACPVDEQVDAGNDAGNQNNNNNDAGIDPAILSVSIVAENTTNTALFFRNIPVKLRANEVNQTGEALAYAWSITTPQGNNGDDCQIELPLADDVAGNNGDVVVFQPTCVGEHRISLQVRTTSGLTTKALDKVIDVVEGKAPIAQIRQPSQTLQHFAVQLDAGASVPSQDAGNNLYAWSVIYQGPENDENTDQECPDQSNFVRLIGDTDAETIQFLPECTGIYRVTLDVTNDIHGAKNSISQDITIKPSFVSRLGGIREDILGAVGTIAIDVDPQSIPRNTSPQENQFTDVQLIAQFSPALDPPRDVVIEQTGDLQFSVKIPLLTAHEQITAALHVQVQRTQDDAILAGSEVTATLQAKNSIPVVGAPRLLSHQNDDGTTRPVLIGDDVTFEIPVTDRDNDEITCEAEVTVGSGLVVTALPSEVVDLDHAGILVRTTLCRFRTTMPRDRTEQFVLLFTANDGFDESIPSSITVKAGSAPPSIDELELAAGHDEQLNYTCTARQNGPLLCTTDELQFNLRFSDDLTSQNNLAVSFSLVSLDDGVGTAADLLVENKQENRYALKIEQIRGQRFAGAYRVVVSVTDEADVSGNRNTVTSQLPGIIVLNRTPQFLATQPGPFSHRFNTITNQYESSVLFRFEIVDADEGSLLVPEVTPTFCVGSAANCGIVQNVSVTADTIFSPTTKRWQAQIISSQLSNIVGETQVLGKITDQEGEVGQKNLILNVQNTPPTIQVATSELALEHKKSGNTFQTESTMQFTVADIDNDPLQLAIQAVTCPGNVVGVRVNDQKFTCGARNIELLGSLALAAGTTNVTRTVRITSNATDNYLGEYNITYSVTDTNVRSQSSGKITINNKPPVLALPSGRISPNHLFFVDNGTQKIKLDPASLLSVIGKAQDINLDGFKNLTVSINDADYTLQRTQSNTSGFIRLADRSEINVSITSDLNAAYSEFLVDRDLDLVVSIKDDFNAETTLSIPIQIQNRVPVYTGVSFDSIANLNFDRTSNSFSTTKAWNVLCIFLNAGVPVCVPSNDLAATTKANFAAQDPDGDPLQVKINTDAVTCPHNKMGDASNGAFITLPTDKKVSFTLQGKVTNQPCDTKFKYDEYIFDLECGAECKALEICSLNMVKTSISDSIASITGPTQSVNMQWNANFSNTAATCN